MYSQSNFNQPPKPTVQDATTCIDRSTQEVEYTYVIYTVKTRVFTCRFIIITPQECKGGFLGNI